MKRRYLSTLLGGYRIVADETSDSYIGFGLHIGQIVIIALPIAITFIVRMIVIDPMAAGIASGAIMTSLNLIFMVGAYFVNKNVN